MEIISNNKGFFVVVLGFALISGNVVQGQGLAPAPAPTSDG